MLFKRILPSLMRHSRLVRNFNMTSQKLTLITSRKPVLMTSPNVRSFHTAMTSHKVVPFVLSDIGEGIKEVEVIEWFVDKGDEVSQFDDICEVQSDKASVVITSRFDGHVTKLYYDVGDVAQVGDPLVDIKLEGDAETAEEVKKETPQTKSEPPKVEQSATVESTQVSSTDVSSGKVLATPAIRHYAKTNNIDLSTVTGSGENGRILMEDLKKPETPTSVQPSKVIVQPTVVAEDRVEKVKGIRKAMWHSMTSSLQIPHFGYDDEINMTSLVELRKHVQEESVRVTGNKISFMPFILKACSLALNQFPILNSHIDVENESIVYKSQHNIGVAVDTPHGLLLPTVKQVNEMSVSEISVELRRLQQLGMNNKLQPSDLIGGTFSLSNIGSIGGTYARPVIFPPQVSIGALGKIQQLPRFVSPDSNEVSRQHLMCVSWSADHRVIEGATMARFSNMVKNYLENPDQMLLHLK